MGKDDSSAYDALRSAIGQIVDDLAHETPKIYIRYVSWRISLAAPSNDRIGFRVSTHSVYNNYADVDYVFERLAQLIKASGLPTLT